MTERPEDRSEHPEPNIVIEPDKMAGVWANFARVGHSPYEFTLDFVRLDFSTTPPQGVVVARVSVSPLMVSQLIDTLNRNWDSYVRKAMPPEVRQLDEPSVPIDRPPTEDPPPAIAG